MAANARGSSSNGVLTNNLQAPGGAVVNKKKQKRRQKEALRAASQHFQQSDLPPLDNPPLDARPPEVPHTSQYDDPNFSADPYEQDGGGYAYSDDDNAYDYRDPYPPSGAVDPSNAQSHPNKQRRKSRGRTTQNAMTTRDYARPEPPRLADEVIRRFAQKKTNSMWDTDSIEERKRIKQFWLDLPEEKRRGLVNIEKRHVLEKMKEQQKHSCSCTVCGRKRTAIEEELEVLYVRTRHHLPLSGVLAIMPLLTNSIQAFQSQDLGRSNQSHQRLARPNATSFCQEPYHRAARR